MTPDTLAQIHARALPTSRSWDADEFRALLDSPTTHLVTAPGCFALIRCVADEAELIMIATDPDQQGRGFGRKVLTAAHSQAQDQGCTHMFLEVAADNAPARALYASLGYSQIGARRGYYTRRTGAVIDAIVLRKPLIAHNGQAVDASSGVF